MMCGIFAIIDSGPEIIVQLNQGSLAKPDKHTKNNNQPCAISIFTCAAKRLVAAMYIIDKPNKIINMFSIIFTF